MEQHYSPSTRETLTVFNDEDPPIIAQQAWIQAHIDSVRLLLHPGRRSDSESRRVHEGAEGAQNLNVTLTLDESGATPVVLVKLADMDSGTFWEIDPESVLYAGNDFLATIRRLLSA